MLAQDGGSLVVMVAHGPEQGRCAVLGAGVYVCAGFEKGQDKIDGLFEANEDILHTHNPKPGLYHAKWDLRNMRGEDIASGVYLFMVKVKIGALGRCELILMAVNPEWVRVTMAAAFTCSASCTAL